MKRLLPFLFAGFMGTSASAQGVMVTKNQMPTYYKGITALTFGDRTVSINGTTLPADDVYPFPTGTLIPGETARLDFTSKATSKTLRIVSPYVWMASNVPEGFTLSQNYGTIGYQEITISVNDNATATSFAGTLTLMGGTGNLYTIELSQMGAQDPANPYVYMPDERFENFILKHYDSNHDGLLSKNDEALAIKRLNIHDMHLQSIKGVEQMKNLEWMDCSYNDITGTLSVEGLTHLKALYAQHNLMTTLVADGCESLDSLLAHDCYPTSDYSKAHRPFKNISLKGCKAITFLHLEDNHLEALDLSDCTSLDFVKATDNCFPSVDVTRSPKLRILQCRKNDNLNGTIDLTHCPDLEELWASETKLEGIIATNNKKLNYIDVHATNLTRLDVTGCAGLRKLYAHSTGIRSLDLSACSNLELLWVKFDNMQELDLSHCSNLTELQAGSNALQTLDLSKCTKLKTLEVNNNRLLSLNISGCSQLTTIQANHNLLTRLDVSKNTALTQIDLLGNRLTTLDVNTCKALTTLQVSENKLTSLTCDQCEQLYYIYAEHNELSTIDLSHNTLLTEVALGHNNLTSVNITGLSNVGELELNDNKLVEVDFTGMISVQELYIQNNPTLQKLETRPLSSMRQLDCRNTGIKVLDVSPNPAMAFLFATGCPNLRTVYILEGADYSALEVDEGVEIIEKQPDQIVPDPDDDTKWNYGEGCTDFIPMTSMADFDKNAAYLIASPDGNGNTIVASNNVLNSYYPKGVSLAASADGSISKTVSEEVMDYIWRIIPKTGEDGKTHYLLYHEYINRGNYAVSQGGSGDFNNPYSHDGLEGRMWFDTQAEVDALNNGSQYWDIAFDADGNATITSCYTGRKGVTMGYCPSHEWFCIGYSDAPLRNIRLYKLASKGADSGTSPDEPQTNPRIGDFYYSDGTWSTTLNTAKKPIGIVFKVGCATEYGDNISYYRQKDGKTRFDQIRGYVVALEDASDGCWWSAFNDDKGCGCSTSTEDFRGYSDTKSIISTAQAKGGLTSSTSSFPACYWAAIGYEAVCPAPDNSSGWYLPSAFQMSYIWNRVWFDEDGSGRACLENSFKQLGSNATPLYRNDAEYWCSTEQVNSYGNSNYAYYFDFSANNFYNGTISHYRKNTNMLVRSILTF